MTKAKKVFDGKTAWDRRRERTKERMRREPYYWTRARVAESLLGDAWEKALAYGWAGIIVAQRGRSVVLNSVAKVYKHLDYIDKVNIDHEKERQRLLAEDKAKLAAKRKAKAK